MYDLESKTDYILKGDWTIAEFDEVLSSALSINDRNALLQIIRLVMYDYGGDTYKWEFKYTACLIAFNWEEVGIQELQNMVLKINDFPTVKVVIKSLAYLSCGKLEFLLRILKQTSAIKNLNIQSIRFKSQNLKLKARSSLVEISKSIEKDNILPHSLISSLDMTLIPEVQKQIFFAMIMRWFHFDSINLDNYFELIRKKDLEESHYHDYLKLNPYFLEPFHIQVWSKPKFGESLIPDFLVQSIDNRYTVIEIEKPWLPILTKNGNLSAHTTHAKRQALEYREWVISNHIYAKERFPNIWRPFSLVVIGLESELTKEQLQRLNQENESTQGVLKIVGFDWIYNRSKATFENLLKHGFDREYS